jgi:hypothetical protein
VQWVYSGNAFVVSLSFNGTVIVKKISAKKNLFPTASVAFTATLLQAARADSADGAFHLNCAGTAANKVRATCVVQ